MSRFLCRVGLLAFALGLVGSSARTSAQQPSGNAAPDAVELYQKLRDAPIDSSQVYFVRGLRITRGGVNFYLNRGFIGLLAPVGGRVTGMTFSGDGEVLLFPPNAVERRSLAQFTQSAILEERFSAAYFRFTDATAQEVLEQASKPDPDAPDQGIGFAAQWNATARHLSAEYTTRILHDFMGSQDKPFFYVLLEGRHLGKFELSYDQRAPESVLVNGQREKDGSVYSDVWCSYPGPETRPDEEALEESPARVISHKIETRIREDNSLEGRAELELESTSGEDRIVSFEISRQLHIQEVTDDEGNKLPVLPPPSSENGPSAARDHDWIALVLATSHPAGSRYRLTFAYQGNVINNVGNGVLYVGARGSWYPNRLSIKPASYDLTFHYPDRLTLVATGRRVEEGTENGWKHSRWISDGTFRVAGFNLGAYTSVIRKAGNVSVEVYATREVEAPLAEVFAQAHPPIIVDRGPVGRSRTSLRVIASPPPPDPAALLNEVAAKASDALSYFGTLFGPFPYSRLALAQIPGNFAQGWPELIYLPTLSFLPGDGRSGLIGEHAGTELAAGLFVTHEIAHQWWGNEVGWKTYHDQWLSEGFATYASALAVAREKDGERKFRDLMRGYKHDLLVKNSDGSTIESGGPIWLGHRLSNSLNPNGYENIIYKKSCWVLHMLRKLMTDPKTGSDERFFVMLRDFVSAYRSKNPSTEDFLRHASRYMTPGMDLDRNGRLDWFFADWVYDAGIPTYKLEVDTRRIAGNRYEIQGTIEQSGVPDNFEMLVPVVATMARGAKTVLGRVVVGSAGGKFRFTTAARPSHVALDDEALLAVVR